jgi:signal transduction histidine kinase
MARVSPSSPLGRQALATLRIRRETDVATTRARTRIAAHALGLAPDHTTAIVTAASEVAHAIVSRRWGGELLLEASDDGVRLSLMLTFRTTLRLEADLESSFDPLRTAQHLSDDYNERIADGHCEIVLVKHARPARADARLRVARARQQLSSADAGNSSETVRAQNRELVRLLAELRRRGQELERMNDQLRRANNTATAAALRLSEVARRKDELSAAVAHDLRSPLAAVKGAIDLLASGVGGVLSPEQQRYLEIAERAARNVLELVNDLLDSSILDAGLARLELEPVELAPFLDEISFTYAFLAREKGIDFRLEIPRGLPPVRADRHKLGQILANLMTNAVKFTDAGGRIVLSATASAGHLWIVVADTGVGIGAERIGELFDKFQRSHSRGTRGERGTGLGLYICKQLVELHGGTIAVESREGGGTTFRLSFPAYQGDVLSPIA